GLVIAVIAWELYTCVGLDVAAGKEGTVVDAWRTIVGRAESFILPAVLLAAGYTLVTLPLNYAQPPFVSPQDPPASGRGGSGFRVVAVIVLPWLPSILVVAYLDRVGRA